MSQGNPINLANAALPGAAAARARPAVSRPQLVGMVVLVLLILVSSFATIYSTHACRALYTQLQELESTQWFLQEDYGRLVLEQSTWASHYRVEKVARADLGMTSPDLAQLKVVKQ